MSLINTYDQLKAAKNVGFDVKKLIGISYSSPDASNSRDISTKKWTVFSPFFKTAPDAPWYDHGCKSFGLFSRATTHRERKDEALSQAKAWAESAYGIKEWAKNRVGSYVPKEVNDQFPIPKERQ